MLIIEQIKPYLTALEMLEAIEVLCENGIQEFHAKSAELAFSILWNYDPKGNWVNRYKNSKAVKIQAAVNQINSTAPQATSCQGWDCGVTKTK